MTVPDQPLDNIIWVDPSDLHSNFWNPNVMARAELESLRRSLLQLGWVQPILVDDDHEIVDGYHRWCLSKDFPEVCNSEGKIPIAVLDVDRAEAMMITVRMNRAKGTHAAVRMSDLVRDLIENEGADIEEVAKGIGANRDEIELLLTGGLFKSRDFSKYKYSKAWVPIETTRKVKEEAFEREEVGEEA